MHQFEEKEQEESQEEERSWADCWLSLGGFGGPGRSRWEGPNRTGPKREAHSRAEIARHPQEKQFHEKKRFYDRIPLMQKLCSYRGNSTLGMKSRRGRQTYLIISAPL